MVKLTDTGSSQAFTPRVKWQSRCCEADDGTGKRRPHLFPAGTEDYYQKIFSIFLKSLKPMLNLYWWDVTPKPDEAKTFLPKVLFAPESHFMAKCRADTIQLRWIHAGASNVCFLKCEVVTLSYSGISEKCTGREKFYFCLFKELLQTLLGKGSQLILSDSRGCCFNSSAIEKTVTLSMLPFYLKKNPLA